MDALPCPTRSRAVLIGSGTFDHLDDLPAVQANVPALRALLGGPQGPFRPENCTALIDPASTLEVSAAVRQAAKDASDTLLICYAGHGLIDEDGLLHLAVPRSDSASVYDTAVPYDWIKRAIASTHATRRIVILDCCYSARAFGVQSESVINLADVDGTYVMAAAGETAVALAPPGETYTAFTGELLTTLESGVPGAAEYLSLNTVFRHLRGRLKAKKRPTPLDLDRNGLGATTFIRNNAFVPAAFPAGPDQDVLHVLESTPRTASVDQLVRSVGLLSEQRAATAADIVRTALQVRAVVELAPLLGALFEAGCKDAAERALPALLLSRPMHEIAQLVELLQMTSAEECVVSLLRLSARLQTAHESAGLALALYRAGLAEHAEAVMVGFAMVRDAPDTAALIGTLSGDDLAWTLEKVVRSVAGSRRITDVTALILQLHLQGRTHAAALLFAAVAELRGATEVAEMITAFDPEEREATAQQIFEIGMSLRGPRHMAELVAALQSSRLAGAAVLGRRVVVRTGAAESISQFISHLLAVGQYQHALGTAVDTARLRTVAEFALVTAQLTDLAADQEMRSLVDEAARSCSASEAAFLITRLEAAWQVDSAWRIFWLNLDRPVGHAAETLTHLTDAESAFLRDSQLSGMWRRRPPADIAKLALAMHRGQPDKASLLLDISDRSVYEVAILVESLERTEANELSNLVLRAVGDRWDHNRQARTVIALEERSLPGCAEYLERAAHSKALKDELKELRRLRRSDRESGERHWWQGWRERRPARHTHVLYRVKADERVAEIARRYGVRRAGIIEENRLSPPHTVYPGQVLSLPLQSESDRFLPPYFPRKLVPDAIRPEVRQLQRVLKRAGYLRESVVESDRYGPETCRAVTRFNEEHLLERADDPEASATITRQGWEVLHRLARYQRSVHR